MVATNIFTAATVADPVFDARQNIIEACKHLLQVEEHLRLIRWWGTDEGRECADCVEKHLLTAQSYVEEIASLDPAEAWAQEARLIHQTTVRAIQALEAGASPDQVADLVRPARKGCLGRTRRFRLARSAGALRQLVTKRNLTYAAGALGAWWLLKR